MNIKQKSDSNFSQCWNGFISSIDMKKLKSIPDGIHLVNAIIKLVENHEDEIVKKWESFK